jgi:hypothetical protein
VQFVYKGPILVVMPDGYAYYERGKGPQTLELSPKPSEAHDLARAAVPAVQLLAKQHGVDVEIPPLGGGTSMWRDRALLAGAAIVGIGLFLGALRLRRRRP